MSNLRNVNFKQICESVGAISRGYYASPNHFTINSIIASKDCPDSEKKIRICFCSTPQQGDYQPSTIYYVDIPSDKESSDPLEWQPLLDVVDVTNTDPSLEDELLKERMRNYTDGISDYSLICQPSSSQLIYRWGGNVLAHVPDVLINKPPLISNHVKLSMGCLMAKMCSHEPHLVCFTDGTNLHVYHVSQPCPNPLQITRYSDKVTGFSAGFPTYIMQEEFDRYEGFWWCPVKSSEDAYYVLYEENDESNVPILNLPDFTLGQSESSVSQGRDNSFRFPHPGKNNSISNLKLVSFRVNDLSIQDNSVVVEELSQNLMSIFSEYEYLVRCGWTPCGQFVWCYMLTREQDKASLFAIPRQSFHPPSDKHQKSRIVCLLTCECDKNNWITVDDYLHMFACQRNGQEYTLDFLIASDHHGYRHIYYVKRQWSFLEENDQSPLIIESTSLAFTAVTQGDWEMTSDTPILDEKHHLVYFTARKEHDLMDHVYVQNYIHPRENPVLLTSDTSFSYSIHVNTQLNIMILAYSNHRTTGAVDIMSICLPTSVNSEVLDLNGISITRRAVLHRLVQHEELFHNLPPPTLQKYQLNDANGLKGLTMYGLLFLPQSPPPSERGYPCLHYIYGGPGVQMVTGEYPRHIYRFAYQCTTQGYALFVCDGPGSKNRGNAFAKVIKHNMGFIELEYQVLFIHQVTTHAPIDASKLAIHGWSYGGYMTLMAMAQFNDVYRVGIAGGSVTQWELYDTGYTERFLGLPSKHRDAYSKGNVLQYAQFLPDERHRLLLVHGGKDENVHVIHITSLIECLTALNKPYDFILYPNERHRIRPRDHLVASIIAYLQENF